MQSYLAGYGERAAVEDAPDEAACGCPPANCIRAVVKDKPIDPAAIEKYLAGKSGEALEVVR